MTGGRACETRAYKHTSYPFALLGPITITWQPLSSEDVSPGSSHGPRVIWVRCHPDIFEDGFDSLWDSASHVLEESKKKDPKEPTDLVNVYTIQDPRRVIGSRRLISRVPALVIRAHQRLGDECDSCRTVLCEQGLGCVCAFDVVRDYVIVFA